jgi:serine phosphatase RsbU (regulator of sigma subunit)
MRNPAPSPLVECLLETIRQFSAGAVQSDDMTILALRYVTSVHFPMAAK